MPSLHVIAGLHTHGFQVGRSPQLPPAVDAIRNARLRDDDRLADARVSLDGLRMVHRLRAQVNLRAGSSH